MTALKKQSDRKTAPTDAPSKSRPPIDVVSACREVMARFPKVLARLAE